MQNQKGKHKYRFSALTSKKIKHFRGPGQVHYVIS